MTARAQLLNSPAPLKANLPVKPKYPVLTEEQVIADICAQYRLRQDYVRAQGNLDRQLKAMVSRYVRKPKVSNKEIADFLDTISPLDAAHFMPIVSLRDAARARRKEYEKNLIAAAKVLPIFTTFVKPTHGLGEIGLALIVGEAGGALYPNYGNPAKVWRRFGLHLQADKTGRNHALSQFRSGVAGSLSKVAWEAVGYSPRRRAVMYVVTDSLLKKDNAYKRLCDERKLVEREKAAKEGLIVAASADIPPGKRHEYRSVGHIRMRAERYVTKRLLRDLWRAWRDHHVHDDNHHFAAVSPRPS